MHALLASIALALTPGGGEREESAKTSSPTINRIVINGTETFQGRDVEARTSSFIDRPLAPNDLQLLADELSDACQQEGYLLCRAEIPRQDFSDGILAVTFNEGYFADVEAPASALPVVRHVFREVLAERPVKEKTFRKAVALLDDIPGLTVSRVMPQQVSRDAYILEVNAQYQHYGLRGLVTNRGSRRNKPWKAFLGGELNSAFILGDRLSGGVLTRPEVVDELAFFRLRYDAAPFLNGVRPYIEGALSNASPRSELGGRNVEGSLQRGTIGVLFPILRREGQRVDMDISFEFSDSDEVEDGLTLFHDRLSVVRADLLMKRRFSNGISYFSAIGLSAGLDILDAGGQSRPDGEANFTKIEMRGEAGLPLPGSFLFRLGGHAQASDSPLLFSEEFSFGGGKFGRGYDSGEILGEHGAAAYMELARPIRTNSVIRRYEPFLYADVGTVWNEGAGLSADGKPLYSAGGGLRLRGKHGWALTYEAAMPLTNAPYTLEDDYVRQRVDLSFTK